MTHPPVWPNYIDHPGDYMGGCGLGSSPCANCEDYPARKPSLFCSKECRDEYEGTGDWGPGGKYADD